MLAEESANSSANSLIWQGCQPTKSFKKLGQVRLGCLTDELAEELGNSSANVGFLE
jgi:hypothetical protein